MTRGISFCDEANTLWISLVIVWSYRVYFTLDRTGETGAVPFDNWCRCSSTV